MAVIQEWKMLTKREAMAETKKWNTMSSSDFDANIKHYCANIKLSSDYQVLRDRVIDAFNTKKYILEGNSERKEYLFDLNLGLDLYFILQEYGFSIRQASIDGIWFYLGIKVFPDIMAFRWKKNVLFSDQEKNIASDHVWKKNRRIYLKSIWWYVHLSLQEKNDKIQTRKATLEVLHGNSTDTIVQVVERAGSSGYRVDLSREIMRQYADVKVADSLNRQYFLRHVMVYNTARIASVEPNLVDGGIPGYVKNLFEQCGN